VQYVIWYKESTFCGVRRSLYACARLPNAQAHRFTCGLKLVYYPSSASADVIGGTMAQVQRRDWLCCRYIHRDFEQKNEAMSIEVRSGTRCPYRLLQ